MENLKRLEWIGVFLVLVNLTVSIWIPNEMKLNSYYKLVYNVLFAVGSLITFVSFFIRKIYKNG